MGANAVALIKALGVTTIDVLGFSIGGFVAQQITLQAPDLVRLLVLVGTGPRGGQGMATLTPEAQQIFGATYDEPDHLWLAVFFTPSKASQAAGREFLKRFRLRTENRDPEVNEKVAPAQLEAIVRWGAPLEKPFDYLKEIAKPALVVNGGKDVIIYPVNSNILQQELPNAQLILYPDSAHGSQYQDPKLFVWHVSTFSRWVVADGQGNSAGRGPPKDNSEELLRGKVRWKLGNSECSVRWTRCLRPRAPHFAAGSNGWVIERFGRRKPRDANPSRRAAIC
jgi:pimeloyl-ACP methyl ester carboxylesterase